QNRSRAKALTPNCQPTFPRATLKALKISSGANTRKINLAINHRLSLNRSNVGESTSPIVLNGRIPGELAKLSSGNTSPLPEAGGLASTAANSRPHLWQVSSARSFIKPQCSHLTLIIGVHLLLVNEVENGESVIAEKRCGCILYQWQFDSNSFCR